MNHGVVYDMRCEQGILGDVWLGKKSSSLVLDPAYGSAHGNTEFCAEMHAWCWIQCCCACLCGAKYNLMRIMRFLLQGSWVLVVEKDKGVLIVWACPYR